MPFIKTLIDSIVDNRNMPKVQVERELSPILDIFMIDILENLIGKKGDTFKYILSEFPLQIEEETNRSKNIDSLFLQNDDTLVFIELKTDNSSYDKEQKNNYKDVIGIIEDTKSSAFLFDFLDTLAEESKKKEKYIAANKVIKKNFNDIERKKLKQINRAKLIYIVPEKTKELLKNDNRLKAVSFKDISEIDESNVSRYKDEWKIIANKIVDLEKA